MMGAAESATEKRAADHVIRLVTIAEAAAHREALIDLLVDAVDGGASVNFIQPMTRDKAARWWQAALAAMPMVTA